MTKLSRVSAAALVLAAGAGLAGAAQAQNTTYYYTDDTTTSYAPYSDSFAPSTSYYYSNSVIVQPAPQVYYTPVYTERSNTTYYNSGSTHSGHVGSSPAYRTYYAPRVVYTAPATTYYAPPVQTYSYSAPAYPYSPPPPYGYVPPGLSINVGTGTYAPLYGGWNSYSSENVGGYDGYRTTPDR